MRLKTIQVEFHASWGRLCRDFSGWVYYGSNGDNYEFFEAIPGVMYHKLLATIPKCEVRHITEKIL